MLPAYPSPAPPNLQGLLALRGLDFHVPDVLWRAVIDGQVRKVPGLGAVVNPVLCLANDTTLRLWWDTSCESYGCRVFPACERRGSLTA